MVDIVTKDGGILDLVALSSSPYTINLKTESSQFEESSSDENIQLIFESRTGNKIGIQTSFGSDVNTQSETAITKGLSDYGVFFQLDDPSVEDSETLKIQYPATQRFAQVFIELNAGSSFVSGSTEALPRETTCNDKLQNNDETGIDCGGSCDPCEVEKEPEEKEKNPVIPKGPQCSGCSDGEGGCLDAGTRVGALYCARNGLMQGQKKNKVECAAAFECAMNVCEKNKCGRYISMPVVGLNIGVIAVVLVLIFQIIRLLRK